MNGRKTWERGYAAGLIDGEGCISIRVINPTENNRQINACYNLQVSMNMVDGDSIDFMYGCYGGNIYHKKVYQENRQEHWRWEITSEKAMIFLKQILPFLRCKKPQAELGIRFQIERRKLPKVINQHNMPSSEQLKSFLWYYKEMQRLKTVKNPCAAATTNRINSQKVGSDSLVLQEKETVS